MSEEEEVVPAAYVRAARHFSMVPVGVLTADISPAALKVYAILRSYSRPGKATFPFVATVCEAFKISESTFRRGLAELSETGLVVVGKRTSRGGFRRSNEYFFPDVDDGMTDPERSDMTGMEPPNLTGMDRPNLTGPIEVEKKEVEKSKRGTPRGVRTTLPDSFEVSDGMKAWALSKAQRVTDLTTETEKFKDYHLAHASKFSDWPAAWRTWIRRADTYVSEKSQETQGTWW